MSILLRQYVRQILSEINSPERIMRELIKELVASDREKQDLVNVGRDITKSVQKKNSAAMKRMNKSKSSGSAADLLLSKLGSEWKMMSAAASGSQASDLVLKNVETGATVSIEVKDYASLKKLKVEISVEKKKQSALAKTFGMDASKFSSSSEDIFSRIEDPELQKKIEDALEQPGQTYLGLTKVKGIEEERHVTVIKGSPGDWSRVRHSSSESGTKRNIHTASMSSVTAASSNKNVDLKDLASSVVKDFTSKNDDYIMLLSPQGAKLFNLAGNDPLGLGAPTFDESSIDVSSSKEPFKLTTHGGGRRPAVEIKLKPDAGLSL